MAAERENDEDAHLMTKAHPQLAQCIKKMIPLYSEVPSPAKSVEGVNRVLFVNIGHNIEMLTFMNELATTVTDFSINF